MTTPQDRINATLERHNFKHFFTVNSNHKAYCHRENNRNQVDVKGNKWKHHAEYNQPAINSGVGWRSLEVHFNSLREET